MYTETVGPNHASIWGSGFNLPLIGVVSCWVNGSVIARASMCIHSTFPEILLLDHSAQVSMRCS